MTFLAGAAAAASQLLRVVSTSGKIANIASLVCVAYGVVLGLLIGFQSLRIARIEGDIEDAADTLDDKPDVARVLQEIAVSSQIAPPWTIETLRDAAAKWSAEYAEGADLPLPVFLGHVRRRPLAACVRSMGVDEFVRLLVAKAKEKGLLDEREQWINDELVITYDVIRNRAPDASTQ